MNCCACGQAVFLLRMAVRPGCLSDFEHICEECYLLLCSVTGRGARPGWSPVPLIVFPQFLAISSHYIDNLYLQRS